MVLASIENGPKVGGALSTKASKTELQRPDLASLVRLLEERLQSIAQHEMARQRRRLGQLAPEQEHALEALLLSVVNSVSRPIVDSLRRSHLSGRTQEARAL